MRPSDREPDVITDRQRPDSPGGRSVERGEVGSERQRLALAQAEVRHVEGGPLRGWINQPSGEVGLTISLPRPGEVRGNRCTGRPDGVATAAGLRRDLAVEAGFLTQVFRYVFVAIHT